MLLGDAEVDEAPNEGGGSLGRASVMLCELRAREDAGVETDQGQPGRLVLAEAQLAKRGVAAGQVRDLG